MRYQDIIPPLQFNELIEDYKLDPIVYDNSIDEYKIIQSHPTFNKIDFSNGNNIGKITIINQLAQIWTLRIGNSVSYGVIDSSMGPKDPIAFLSFEILPNYLMAKNAWIEPKYQQKGVMSELFGFVNKIAGNHKILSDELLTYDGEALWNSLIKSTKFNAKIIYLPTNELFDISDINQTKTHDGTIVSSPKDDNTAYKMYDSQQNKNGQKFFYLLEAKEGYSYSFNEKMYESPRWDPSRHLNPIIQPYPHFFDGDP